MNKTFCIIMLLMGALSFSQIRFDNLQTAPGDQAIFTSQTPSPGNGTFQSLFLADFNSRKMDQLTIFPEKVLYLEKTGQLQIHNRFGVFRTDSRLNKISAVDQFPSFVAGHELDSGKLMPLEASEDGRYIVYLAKKDSVSADLMLFELATGRKTVVSDDLQLSYKKLPALWSPDSRYFVYEKNRGIYYFSIEQKEAGRLPSEDYRKLGEGSLSSVDWTPRSELYYLDGRLVYKLLTAEFFTRALYRGQFRTGQIIGKIPEDFDPEFDRFWVSPLGDKILLARSGRHVYMNTIRDDDFYSIDKSPSMPYLLLPRSTEVQDVLWSYDDRVFILTGPPTFHRGENVIFKMEHGDSPRFVPLEDEKVHSFFLSGEEQMVLLLKSDKAEVKDIRTWQTLFSIDHNTPRWAHWIDESRILLSGAYKTELWNLEDSTTDLIAFSQPGEEVGFIKGSDNPGMIIDNQGWKWDAGEKRWVEAEEIQWREEAVITDHYRGYIKPVAGRTFENIVMMRDLTGVKTYSLFPLPKRSFEPFPEREEPVSFEKFNHGSRIRRREVALVFNALDNVEGVSEVLKTLDEYGVKATFFINGDFIRQNPGAAKEIADSGHEVGNLFYVNYNMRDPRFKLDKEFLKQGIARNEDDYFEATGKELALLWHTPGYHFSENIMEVTQEMNYLYVDRDVDPKDWVGLESRGRYSAAYQDSREIIQSILKAKKPGSIIPILLGKVAGNRDDYIFNDLDLLINGLLEQGYSVVPVSTLVENSR